MKPLANKIKPLLASLFLLPLLTSCPEKIPPADDSYLFLVWPSAWEAKQCPPSFSAAETLPLGVSKSQSATEQLRYRIPRSSSTSTTRITITIQSACTAYIRDLEYCDASNQQISNSDFVNCDSGKGPINGYITGSSGDDEICQITYPSNEVFLWIGTSNCPISILPEEL